VSDTTVYDLIESMPKAELHLHLDGALPAETVLELAERNGLQRLLPGHDPEAIVRWYQFSDFYHFMDVVRVIKDLLRTEEDFALATYAIGRALARQRVRYAEITLTVYTHIRVLPKNLTIERILDGIDEGRRRVAADFGIELRWIFDIPRNRSFADYRNGGPYVAGAAEETLRCALQGREHGVVGLGLAGSEVNAPPEPFRHVFAEARANGLLSVPHAGEGRGPESVRGAVDALQADRIGHGVAAIEDPALVAELAERRIPLEIGLSSNIYLGFYPDYAAHPLPRLDRAGVMVTINTDDPALFNTDLGREYRLLHDVFGYDMQGIVRIARNAFEASGAEPKLKGRLLAEFDAWAQEVRA
jgi:aminodeoxyfutalosine deaminase